MRLIVVLVLGVALLLIINKIYKSKWHRNLTVSVDFDEYIIREGDKNVINEIIENNKKLPIAILQVKFAITRSFIFQDEGNGNISDQYYRNEYFSCGRNEKITRKYEFKASRRGVYRFNSLEIISRDIFAENHMYADIPSRVSVTVLPARIRHDEIPEEFYLLCGEITSKNKLYEDPFDFKSIREYRPFDPFNHINWKATAANDEPEVNTFNTTSLKRVRVLMNIEPHIMSDSEEMAEEIIRIAACVSDELIKRQIPTALETNVRDCETGEIIEIRSGCDSGHIRNIETALAFADTKAYVPFAEIMEKNFCEENKEDAFIVISNLRKSSFTDKMCGYRDAGYGIYWIIPEHKNIPVGDIGFGGEVKWVFDNERQ